LPLHVHELVDEDVAGRADVALEAAPAAQQRDLAVGTPISELREVQLDAFDALERRFQRVRVVGHLQNLRALDFGRVRFCADDLDGLLHHATSFSTKRAALAAALNGSMPTRLSVAMKVSGLPSTLWRSRR
jgi:hypothetical protein